MKNDENLRHLEENKLLLHTVTHISHIMMRSSSLHLTQFFPFGMKCCGFPLDVSFKPKECNHSNTTKDTYITKVTSDQMANPKKILKSFTNRLFENGSNSNMTHVTPEYILWQMMNFSKERFEKSNREIGS